MYPHRWIAVTGHWLLIALLFASVGVSADITLEPPARSRQVTFYVTYFLTQQQISKHALDDEVSQRLFEEFLSDLDSQKLYFLAADIEAFRPERTSLDDALRRLDTSFAHRVFRVYQERVRQRVAFTEKLLEGPINFDEDEELVVDADQLDYPADEQQAQDRWRKQVKYELMSLKLNNDDDQAVRDIVRRRYRNLLNWVEQKTPDELLEQYLNALAQCYDPHSAYFSPGTFEDFRIRMSLNYQGIGAELESRDGYAVIRRIIPGGAAARGGELKENDRIVSVGQGDDGPMVDVTGMKLENIIDLIRGKEGTVVRLGVLREGEPTVKVIKIVRARIELQESAASGTVIERGNKNADTPYRIGVINLPSFYMDMEGARNGSSHFRSSTRDVRALLERFQKDNVDAVVLDLRLNGGGSLTEAIGVTGLFIDQGPVVQVKDSAGQIDVHSDTEAGVAWNGPLVVLVSRFSASASEIVAGAIQDYGRGIVVGDESTHGKGTVQTLVDIGPMVMRFEKALNLGAVKITVQQFYRPSGASTQNRGVVSDIVIPSVTSHMSKGESDLKYALAFDAIPATSFERVEGKVTPMIIDALRSASQRRIEASADFARSKEQVARYEEAVTRKVIPLKWEKFVELRRRDDSEQLQRQHAESLESQSQATIRQDYYLNEVLDITIDYVQLLQASSVAAK